MVIPTIVLAIHSPHYPGISGFVKIFINEILLQYIMLWIGYTVFRDNIPWDRIYRTLYCCVFVITVFAIINLVLHSTPWVTIGGYEHYDEAAYVARERFVVRSIFLQSFMYGFMCIISLVLAFYGYMRNLISKTKWYLILVMCLFGILFSGSRTVWVCSMIFAFFALLSNGNTKIKYITITLGILCSAYFFVPAFSSRVDMLINTFEDGNDITGSSLDMRQMQFNAVMYYIKNNLLFGCGYKYFYFDLGWGQFYSGGRVDADLRGIEGVYLSYLLERGIVGYISYILFYLYLLWLLLKANIQRVSKYMAISILLVYVAFAHMTGDLGTPPIALFFIGLMYKVGITESNNIE